jgi:hypothetical protein
MKTKLERGLYPISLTDVRQLIKIANSWEYGNKATCKYVVECLVDRLATDYEGLTLKNGVYEELISIVHDINGGKAVKKIEISL